MKPNADCDESFCLKRQKEFAIVRAQREREALENPVEVVVEEAVSFENEWGIEIVDETVEESSSSVPTLTEGLKQAYELPEKHPEVVDTSEEIKTDEGPSLDDL